MPAKGTGKNTKNHDFQGVFRDFQGISRAFSGCFSLCPFRVCPLDPSQQGGHATPMPPPPPGKRLMWLAFSRFFPGMRRISNLGARNGCLGGQKVYVEKIMCLSVLETQRVQARCQSLIVEANLSAKTPQ